MKYLIGLDIGTSSIKGVLISENGEITDKINISFQYSRKKDRIVEISAENFLDVCLKAIKILCDSADGKICSICASAASGNLLLVDKLGNPMTPIINWQDNRVTDEAKEILGDINLDELYERVGWPFDFETFPLAQLCYIKKHGPEILAKCSMVTMSTEYLYYVLTGKWGISTSAGTPFYLIDQRTGKYIPEIIEKLGINEAKLPPIMSCGKVLGYTTEKISNSIGIPEGIPVVLGSFDHPSAARGAGILKEGEMLLSCGTSWVGFFPVKSRDKIAKAKTLIDPFLSPDGCWATMVSVPSVSADIKNYIERYIDSSDNKFNVLSDLAQKSEKGADGLVINPKDLPNDNIILKYKKEHIARAIMEGTVRLLKDKLDELKVHGITADTAVMVGGPSENPLWIKIIEDICSINVKVVHGAVAGAMGAAMLGGVGIGVYKDEQDAFSNCY